MHQENACSAGVPGLPSSFQKYSCKTLCNDAFVMGRPESPCVSQWGGCPLKQGGLAQMQGKDEERAEWAREEKIRKASQTITIKNTGWSVAVPALLYWHGGI